MPTNALETISPRQGQACFQTEHLARRWIVTLAELFSVSLKDRGPRFVDLWVSAVADLKPEQLEAACRRSMQICKFFPMPAEIRTAIEQPEAKALQLEAEEEWHRALHWVQRNYHPDLGVSRKAPELPPQTVHALRAAGALSWIFGCSDAEMQWAKKKFLSDYQLVSESGKVRHLLTQREARDILAKINPESAPKLKALPG